MTDTIVSRVQKLLRLATSSNPNEAALAAAKAQELIDRHQLTTAMLELDPSGPSPESDEPIINFDDSPLDGQGKARTPWWRIKLAMTIARWNSCQIYTSGPAIKIVGRPSDAETVRYLYAWLAREIERLADRDGRGKGTAWRNAFRVGVIDTIANKLRAQRTALQQEYRAGRTGQELVRVDRAIQKLEDRRMEVHEWVRLNMKLRAGSGHTMSGSFSAREAGRRAGHAINLGARTGITTGTRGLLR